jgi:dihydrofolate synthase/folylpolyglutamate synthase
MFLAEETIHIILRFLNPDLRIPKTDLQSLPMDTEKAYNLALDYLYSFVDYSLKHASELAKAEFNLERMFALMELLGNPHRKYPVLHVAGTKGKGSVSALAASALGTAGYVTGLYTSPHLQDYAERIQIDGNPIPHAELAALVEQLKPAVARVPKLTTFEITTALGFLYFASKHVDVAVIEVGLGGRLDATNVVDPRVAVITSLSLDHTAVLGDTLDKIAAEKAGIIKPDRPVVVAPQKSEALDVLVKIADERNAPLTLVGRDVLFASGQHSLDGQTAQIWSPGEPPFEVRLPLLGEHQVENAAVAASALWTLREQGVGLSDDAIQRGFAQVKWPARFQVVRRNPAVIFDSAHNQDSFAKLRQTLDLYFPGQSVNLVFGASEDKNLPGMFAEMKGKIKRLIVTRADHPRALEPEKIRRAAKQAGIESEVLEPVEAAFERALELSQKDGSIALSAGSMFVTAEVMAAWEKLSK